MTISDGQCHELSQVIHNAAAAPDSVSGGHTTWIEIQTKKLCIHTILAIIYIFLDCTVGIHLRVWKIQTSFRGAVGRMIHTLFRCVQK